MPVLAIKDPPWIFYTALTSWTDCSLLREEGNLILTGLVWVYTFSLWTYCGFYSFPGGNDFKMYGSSMLHNLIRSSIEMVRIWCNKSKVISILNNWFHLWFMVGRQRASLKLLAYWIWAIRNRGKGFVCHILLA